MGMIDDIRKLLQDIITPDLKALQVQVKAGEEASKARDIALEAKMDLKFQAVLDKMDLHQTATDLKFQSVLAKIDYNQASILNAMSIEKRVDAIERQNTRTAA